jgi:hypothetical protein
MDRVMHPHPIQISFLYRAVKSAGRVARNFKKSRNKLGEPLLPCDFIFNDGATL